ncbi:ubiquitin carboxyl-terminal hydrolase 14-like [Sinocyclocheilus grahami]|uniref:ubiquitin carboxyl-terminal hydrolase 14-like n=1 Tax=Sinocyclocheilus grahami TaxID=75366 RepID=UPI0007ACA048|nr:PREDICTED: ubiquitin carboxyl-terminal hydrolase 14-like [Sinocyclocheilus grahami]
MPVFTVNVKWGKEKFDAVELNTEEPPMVFKAQLFALTGVQPERQKVMMKGGTLKDDEWGNIKLKNGMTLLMMGSADALPEEPVVRPMFVEDMTEEQLASAMELPCGLTNLGNTCYMNATVQCLRSVPELKDALRSLKVLDLYVSSMKCTESEDEDPTKGTESQLQLSCFINTEVKYLATGLRLRLQEDITKFSPSLKRNALYIKSSKISRLPAYLTVQMVRFFYKEKESVNAKVLKDVKFPLMLDVYELCTAELQEKMVSVRSKFKVVEDKKLEMQQQPKENLKVGAPKETKYEPFCFSEDLGSSNSGYYDLQAVLTHQGRSSSSGHYVAWVKRKEDEWVKFDDDKVSVVTPEDILKLSGGGDWHIAYVLLYGPRRLEILE